jgi:ABC-type multidrug transport system fused ATPase/permease subunit
MGFVSQDIFLFNDTVANNIRYARPDASEEEVYRAARAARADEFISELSQGYSTLVGERGVKLSMGQRQRLSIARALLKAPDLLILDEPSSALDSRTEYQLKEALTPLIQDRTCIIIAHRLSTVLRADRILVLDQGHIVEEGTHRELVARHGLYHELCREQLIIDVAAESLDNAGWSPDSESPVLTGSRTYGDAGY